MRGPCLGSHSGHRTKSTNHGPYRILPLRSLPARSHLRLVLSSESPGRGDANAHKVTTAYRPCWNRQHLLLAWPGSQPPPQEPPGGVEQGYPGSLPFPFPSFPLLWGLPSAWQLVLAAPREGPFCCPLIAGWAKTCYPGGNHSPLPPSPIPSWICPFLSIPSHTTPYPIFLPLITSPLSFFYFRKNKTKTKLKAAEAGSPPPDPLPRVVTVSVGRITRKGIENCEGVQGRGQTLL